MFLDQSKRQGREPDSVWIDPAQECCQVLIEFEGVANSGGVLSKYRSMLEANYTSGGVSELLLLVFYRQCASSFVVDKAGLAQLAKHGFRREDTGKRVPSANCATWTYECEMRQTRDGRWHFSRFIPFLSFPP